MIEIMKALKRLREIINMEKYFRKDSVNGKKRIRPYPPSLSKTPAKIIEPTRGASTWAFGNQIWRKKIGNLTINTKEKEIIK